MSAVAGLAQATPKQRIQGSSALSVISCCDLLSPPGGHQVDDLARASSRKRSEVSDILLLLLPPVQAEAAANRQRETDRLGTDGRAGAGRSGSLVGSSWGGKRSRVELRTVMVE